MSITLNDNTYILAGKPIEPKSFHPDNRPFTSVAEANATNDIGVRYPGLAVSVNGH